jgi:hypothetical protein
MNMRLRRLLVWLHEVNTQQGELIDRYLLLNQPWEEDFLHWSHDGEHWRLHGHLLPPRRGRHSTTPSGWCTTQRRYSVNDR